jgi:F-type H+-transporting ATPase subunit a
MVELIPKTIFTLSLFGISLPVTETVIVSWAVMAILIAASLLLTRRFREIPAGPQAVLEGAVEFLNGFAKNQFGRWDKYLAPYIGSLFLFLFTANIIGVLSPVEIEFGEHKFEPLFIIRPPTTDIGVTAALAALSILLLLFLGFAARGFGGWFKRLLYPIPLMLPFNILEYGTRLASLMLRLFGNIFGGYMLMRMIEGLLPVALPMICSLYFDFFDGMLQAVIFVFLTSLYISEAVKVHEEE